MDIFHPTWVLQIWEVLEVGAGRGLVGLAAWALGASMWVTDLAYTLEARGWNMGCCDVVNREVKLTWGGLEKKT